MLNREKLNSRKFYLILISLVILVGLTFYFGVDYMMSIAQAISMITTPYLIINVAKSYVDNKNKKE